MITRLIFARPSRRTSAPIPRSRPGARRNAAKIAPMAAGPRRTDHRHRDEAALLVLINAGGGSGACCCGIMPENLEPTMVMT
jgi:hypothetical protein